MESAKNKLNNKYRFTPRIKPHGVTAHGATSHGATSQVVKPHGFTRKLTAEALSTSLKRSYIHVNGQPIYMKIYIN